MEDPLEDITEACIDEHSTLLQRLRNVKSPQNLFQEEERQVRERIGEEMVRCASGFTGAPEEIKYQMQDRLRSVFDELDKLKDNYETSWPQAQQDYKLTLERNRFEAKKESLKQYPPDRIKELVDELSTWLGESSRNQAATRATPDPEDTRTNVEGPGPSVGCPGQRGAAEPPQHQSPSNGLDTENEGGRLAAEIVCAPQPGLGQDGSSSTGAATQTFVAHEEPQRPKRKPTTTRDDSNRHKRQCTAPTIEFDEVYQNGNARVKYKIVEYPTHSGRFYILRCKTHKMTFYKSPLPGAAKHLSSKDHDELDKRYGTAIHALGVLVLNCTPERCKLNNEAVEEALLHGYTPPGDLGLRAGEAGKVITGGDSQGRHTATESTRVGSRSRGILNSIQGPRVGQLYNVFWGPSKKPWPAIVLPTNGPCLQVRLRGSIQDLGLIDYPPDCYEIDPISGKLSGWVQGFGDGEPGTANRQYPVLFFDGKNFPDDCSPAWVHTKDFKEYNPLEVGEHEREMVESWQNGAWTADSPGTDDTDTESTGGSSYGDHARRPALDTMAADAFGAESEGQRANQSALEDQIPNGPPKDAGEEPHHGTSEFQDAGEEPADGCILPEHPLQGYPNGRAFGAEMIAPIDWDNAPRTVIRSSEIRNFANEALGNIVTHEAPGAPRVAVLSNGAAPVVGSGPSAFPINGYPESYADSSRGGRPFAHMTESLEPERPRGEEAPPTVHPASGTRDTPEVPEWAGNNNLYIFDGDRA